MSRIFSVIGTGYESPGQARARARERIRPVPGAKPRDPGKTAAELAWEDLNRMLDRWNKEHGRQRVSA
jgi:hypothetical protein